MDSIEPLEGPFAWYGDDMDAESRWRFSLDAADHDELDLALSSARKQGISVGNLTRDGFPLNRLKEKLLAVSNELEEGCGYARIRGLELERWSDDDIDLVWMGLARHIGTFVYQNPDGQILREITAEPGNVGEMYGQLETGDTPFLSSRARTASTAGLRFHTDRCDIVALLCRGQAEIGGDSRIASSVTVHNEMLRRAPELCVLLYEDLPRSRIGEERGGESLWYNLPVWGVRDGKFTSHYSRTYVEALEHVEGAPRVTEMQWRAMDMLAEIAREVSYSMRLQPGDIQFLNNHVIYHSRDAYRDNPKTGCVRKLLRVWLTAPSRALPASHKVLWREVDAGRNRGGISPADSFPES